jgi:hypothetical protein
MNKKPLIGVSIVAVILLVMGSLSNVVGYQTENFNKKISETYSDDIVIQGTMGENGWYISTVEITFINGNYTFYRIDYGPWTAYTSPIIIGSDGIHLFEATSDFVHIYNLTIKIDCTAPVIKLFSMTRAGFFKWEYTANVSDNTRGINRVEFYLDDQLVGTCSTNPYIYYWTGFLFLYRLKNLILYHTTRTVANCVVYDNAGNNQVPPIPIP